MLNSFRAKSSCETEAKFMQDRIVSVERTVSDLCNIFAGYSRKAARLRDKNDEISKAAATFAENEQINKSLAVGLENFSESISTVADYGDARVQLIDAKVVNEFSRYDGICKHVKDEVKDIYVARDKEINKKRQLERIKERNPRNRQTIIQAETELVKATAEVTRSVHNLEEKVTSFERQKIHDIKSTFLDFISIEMGYHAKALEVLTKAYKDINSIDQESDLEEFKKTLRTPGNAQVSSKPSLFKSGNTFGSLSTLFTATQAKSANNTKKMSKSEETLDSMKHSMTESDESVADLSENLTDTYKKSSPVVVRRHLN